MSPQRAELLKALKASAWLEHLGEPVGDPNVVVAGSWQEAWPHRDRKQRVYWDNLGTPMLYQVARDVNCTDDQWSAMHAEISDELKPIVGDKLAKFMRCRELPKELREEVRSYIRSDLLLACLEAEFAERIQQTFGRELAKWIIAGHFPCGWKGKYPQGKLMIY